MPITEADVHSLVEQRLGLATGGHADLVDMYIEEIGQRIRTYVHADPIPDGLKYTWSAMAAAALSAEQGAVLFPPAEEDEAYETTIGDTTVRPIKAVTPPSRPAPAVIDAIIFDYRAELNAFRKFRW